MNSLINSLYADSNKEPEVGDGATFLHWTDRTPGTVTEVRRFKSGARKGQVKSVLVRADKYEVISGSTHNGTAQYEITDGDGEGMEYKVTKDGRFQRTGGGGYVSIGRREVYYDPHF